MEWFNEPHEWADGDVLRVVADPQTDMWQKTHYGYSYDTAHIYGRTIPGDVTIRATFSAGYAEQYDQAGGALRIDAENWIKAGTEYVDGELHVSVVVTRGFSDWSVIPVGTPGSVTIELERAGDAVTVRYGLDGADPVTMLRLAYFPPGVPALAGIMCAAPVGKGFETRFTHVEIAEIA
jgi:regulation of enolase protein 1 (concanavalin A-like superfamily)